MACGRALKVVANIIIALAARRARPASPTRLGLSPSARPSRPPATAPWGTIGASPPSPLHCAKHSADNFGQPGLCLTLDHLGLVGTLPTELGLLKLSVLDLTHNSLSGTLPTELRKLGLLRERLNNNRLSGSFYKPGRGRVPPGGSPSLVTHDTLYLLPALPHRRRGGGPRSFISSTMAR